MILDSQCLGYHSYKCFPALFMKQSTVFFSVFLTHILPRQEDIFSKTVLYLERLAGCLSQAPWACCKCTQLTLGLVKN